MDMEWVATKPGKRNSAETPHYLYVLLALEKRQHE